jgi:hypothetical protein
MGTTASAARAPSDIRLSRLLFGALGAPAAWAIHLLVNYLLVSATCWTGAYAIMVAVHVVTALTFLVAVAAGVIAWGTWQRLGKAEHTTAGDWQGVSTFLGVWGMAASAIFALLILVGGFAGFFLDPCRSI